MKLPSPKLIVTSFTSILALSGSACSKKEAAPEPTKAPATVAPADADKAPEPTPLEAQADTAKAAEPDAVKVAEPDATAPVDPAGGGLAGGAQPASAVEVAEMPALYAPLFKDGPAVFAWSYEVDTHDAEEKDPVARLTATLTCRSKVTTMVEARIAEQECEVSDKVGTLEVSDAVSTTWVATRDGLWIAAAPPGNPEALADILKGKAVLTTTPTALEEKREGDPDKDMPAWSRRVYEEEGAWCHHEEHDGMYGPIGSTWCFAPDKGLVKAEFSGREGPSNESYLRK